MTANILRSGFLLDMLCIIIIISVTASFDLWFKMDSKRHYNSKMLGRKEDDTGTTLNLNQILLIQRDESYVLAENELF